MVELWEGSVEWQQQVLKDSDNKIYFSKNQKAIKLNNVSFRHICDKNHIFKRLGMTDKDKLQDSGFCALEVGTGAQKLI